MTDDTAEQGRPGRHSTRRSWLPPALQGRGVVVAVITAAALSLGGYSLAAFQLRANEQAQRVDEAVSAVDQLCTQVRELGGYCIVDPADLRGEPGPQGPPGPPPTDEQLRPIVAEFVNEWLSTADLPEGPPGPPPSVETLSTLIALELQRRPPPVGPQGDPGPAPTAEQIRPIVAEEVAGWLLANPPQPGAQGPAGPAGPAGADGSDGAAGKDGAPGEPPMSWTYPVCGVLGCTEYVCTRADPFDPAQPRYECRPVDG